MFLYYGEQKVSGDEKGCGFTITSAWSMLLTYSTKFPGGFKGCDMDSGASEQRVNTGLILFSMDMRKYGIFLFWGEREFNSGGRLAMWSLLQGLLEKLTFCKIDEWLWAHKERSCPSLCRVVLLPKWAQEAE